MKIYPLLILCFFFTACTSEKPTKNKTEPEQSETEPPAPESKIVLERSPLFESYSDEKMKVADFIESYLNTMYDSSVQVRNNFWHSEILTDQQDFFLKGGLEKGFLIHYPPKILGIRELDNNRFKATVYFSQNNFPFKIMELLLAKDGLNRLYFIDMFGENLDKLSKKKNENFTFYYSPKVTINAKAEQKSIDFNRKMADFFEVPAKKITVVALQDLKDYCSVLGYIYSPFLTFDAQTGGIAMPEENIIFSANNSPHYPHELVHLYTGKYHTHNWFDEGLATYFAGSVEYPLEHHLKKLAGQMQDLDFSKIPEDKKIDDDTSFKYAIGGLLCKLAMDEYGGRDAVMQLMKSGKSDEDFHAALKNVFQLNKEEYDSFIKQKLQHYIQ